MPVFKFSCVVTVGAYTEVEAGTLEEAMKEAESRDVVIGGCNSGMLAEESWIIDAADGSPVGIRQDDDD